MPAGWQRVPLSAKDLQRLVEQTRTPNPQLANLLTQQVSAAMTQHMKAFVMKVGGAANVTVMVTGQPAGLDLILTSAKLELAAAGASNIATRTVTIGSHRAVQATYEVDVRTPTRHVHLEGMQDFVLINGQIVVVTLTSQHRRADAAAFEKMTRSLSLR